MQNIVKKFQKPVFIIAAILTGLTFVYALSFSTDMYPLSEHKDLASGAFFYVPGAEMYDTTQDFNRALFDLALFMIVICISLFVYFAQRRRVYYLSNYITCSLFAGYCLGTGIYILANVIGFRHVYLTEVDWEKFKQIAEQYNKTYVKSTFFFDAGIVMAVLLILLAASVAAIAVMKYLIFKRERRAKNG